MAPESITVDLDHAKKLPLFEAWKDISGYEGLYRISNLGRVERMYKHGGSRFLKPSWRGRYLSISLSKGNRKVNATISRLVAMAFIPLSAESRRVHVLPSAGGDRNTPPHGESLPIDKAGASPAVQTFRSRLWELLKEFLDVDAPTPSNFHEYMRPW